MLINGPTSTNDWPSSWCVRAHERLIPIHQTHTITQKTQTITLKFCDWTGWIYSLATGCPQLRAICCCQLGHWNSCWEHDNCIGTHTASYLSQMSQGRLKWCSSVKFVGLNLLPGCFIKEVLSFFLFPGGQKFSTQTSNSAPSVSATGPGWSDGHPGGKDKGWAPQCWDISENCTQHAHSETLNTHTLYTDTGS